MHRAGREREKRGGGVLDGVLAKITNNLRETNVELREENREPKDQSIKKTPSEFLRGSTLLHERAIAILPEATGRCTIAYDER